MRNPADSVAQLPLLRELGALVRELVDTAVTALPILKEPAVAILEEKQEVPQLDQDGMKKVMAALRKVLEPTNVPEKTAVAATPINADILWGWGEHSDDPDVLTLARWLREGAPLGFDQQITRNGVFPPSTDTPADAPSEAELQKDWEDWENWPSAMEESQELHRLIREAEASGFCRVIADPAEADLILKGSRILSKLGVIVKMVGPEASQKKKSRIIWDLRQSRVNLRCNQMERVTLPRLMDAVANILELMREGLEPILAAVDIENAFHNVPVGEDKKYTVAMADMENRQPAHIIYDVLVFGSRSSPTVWGRYAAFLGRALAATFEECRFQIYVDDPLLVIPGVDGQAPEWLAKILVFTKTLGYPLKLSKAHAGREVKWVGATISVDNTERTVKVSIPEDKLQKLLTQLSGFLKAPVVGLRALRSFAGSMAFVAGLVPVLRPFLAPLWAVLARCATNDGGSEDKSSRIAGKLVHTKRIAPSLTWIKALLEGEHGPMVRTFYADLGDEGKEIITDACPWGIGGVLYQNGYPIRWFSSPLTKELLEKFRAAVGDPAHNTLWEAVALLVGLRLWLPKANKRVAVRVKSDNIGALRTLLKLTSPKDAMGTVAREVALDIASGNYQVHELVHIPGVTNVAADALSRLWAPQPAEFPLSIGEEEKDPVPVFDQTFWRAG